MHVRFSVVPQSVDGVDLVVVLDESWTPTHPTDDMIAVREVFGAVLDTVDLWTQASELLDDWAERADIARVMTLDGVSFWYERRLLLWRWLVGRLLWLRVIDAVLAGSSVTTIEIPADAEPDLRDAAAAIAARDGGQLLDGSPATRADADDQIEATDPAATAPPPAPSRRSILERLRGRYRRRQLERRRVEVERRFERLRGQPGALLVLTEHIRQRVQTDKGAMRINAYIDPILDRLVGTTLRPFEVQLDATTTDDQRWNDLRRRRHAGSKDVLKARYRLPDDRAEAADRAMPIVQAVEGAREPFRVDGVDLGPMFRAEVLRLARHIPRRLSDIAWIRRFLHDARPTGILMTNEYSRIEWVVAAHAEGVLVASVQHGIIHPWHLGYVYSSAPRNAPFVDRLYVFGAWERRLVTASPGKPDSIVVSGSPRLDIVQVATASIRASVRGEIGVREDERMVVVSTSWADLARRVDLPVAIGRLVDRPLPGVHFVFKLHPSEEDEGPYRQIVERVAHSLGIEPPRVSIVQHVDLYRLLAAADAHIGLYSTVLTEAVVVGTRNLLMARDLLGYVEAGVATRIANGGDLLHALDDPSTVASESDRRQFLADHFRGGSASTRIREDLLSWLVPATDRDETVSAETG